MLHRARIRYHEGAKKASTTALVLNGIFGGVNRGGLCMFQKGGFLEPVADGHGVAETGSVDTFAFFLPQSFNLGGNMQHDLIDELQTQIETLWAKADLGKSVTLSRVRRDDGSTHIEVVAGRYDIVATERGQETMRKAALSLTEASQYYLIGMATGHAQKRELEDRRAPRNAPLTRYGLTDDGYSR